MRLERNPSSISRVYSINSQPSERRHIRLLPVRQGIGSELVFDRSMHGSTAKLAFDALDKSQTPDRDRMLLARLTTVTIQGNTFGNGQRTARRLFFLWWKGDHPPRHVHVYRDDKLIVKWDLDNQKPMKGKATKHVVDLIAMLQSEGVL